MSQLHNIEIVTDNSRLHTLCEIWKTRDILALDTEFMRVSTFYPIAGLVQVGDEDQSYLIDPLAITEWQPFVSVLQSASVTKILHSCSEDTILFQSMFGCVPAPLFDTQRAAAFLGFGFSISYLNLVFQLMGITLEKGETRSDWLQRPLTGHQLQYAALDVVYLPAIYRELCQRLDQKGFLPFLHAECRQLEQVAGLAENSTGWQTLYQSMGAAWRLNRRQLGALQGLCLWRESVARTRNKPRSWVARDADLIALAEKMPVDRAALNQIKDMNRNLYQQDADDILALVASSQPVTQADAALVEGLPLTQEQRQLLKRCQQQIEEVSKRTGIAIELLARKKQLVSILHLNAGRGPEEPISLPSSVEQGWQKPFLLPALQTALTGRARD